MKKVQISVNTVSHEAVPLKIPAMAECRISVTSWTTAGREASTSAESPVSSPSFRKVNSTYICVCVYMPFTKHKLLIRAVTSTLYMYDTEGELGLKEGGRE